MNSRLEFGQYLKELGLLNWGAEVGVESGWFSRCILEKWPGNLYMIDPWKHLDDYVSDLNSSNEDMEKRFQSALDNVREFSSRCNIMRMTSSEAAEIIDDESLDFVFIDANHDYEHCKQDLEIWYPKVKKGGLFSGHDYVNLGKGEPIEGSDIVSPEVFEVKTAVDEFANKLGVEVQTTIKDKWFEHSFQTWFWVKK
jgi:hypothetical protein